MCVLCAGRLMETDAAVCFTQLSWLNSLRSWGGREALWGLEFVAASMPPSSVAMCLVHVWEQDVLNTRFRVASAVQVSLYPRNRLAFHAILGKGITFSVKANK